MKKFLFLSLSLMLLVGLIAGCQSAPPKAPAAAPAAQAPAPKAVSNLPVTGIGTMIATDVKAKERYKIATIVKNSTNPYMVKLLAGAEKAGKDMGFEAISMAPAQNDNVEAQAQIIEDMIQKGVKGIIIAPVDSNGIMPAIRKAQAAKIPVAVIGTPAAEQTFLRTGVDYTETGYVIAKLVADKLGGKGEVIIIEGPPGAQNAIERLAGIKKALAEYPNMKIVASQTANFMRTQGMQVTENLIQKYKTASAVIAMNDESALGAIQAIKAAGLSGKVLVAGFDGNMDASNAIATGELFASYNTDPFGSAYLAAVYITKFLNDGSNPPQFFVPFPSVNDKPLIVKDNVNEYIQKIAWWK